jgi:hypothetical protein
LEAPGWGSEKRTHRIMPGKIDRAPILRHTSNQLDYSTGGVEGFALHEISLPHRRQRQQIVKFRGSILNHVPR